MKVISDTQYLEKILSEKKLELRELVVQNRIHLSKFNAIRDQLEKDIESIESQLSDSKSTK